MGRVLYVASSMGITAQCEDLIDNQDNNYLEQKVGRGKDQLSLQLGQVPPQLVDALAVAPPLPPPLLLLLRLVDAVPQGAGAGLQGHQVGWLRLSRLTAGLLHDQNLKMKTHFI